MAMTLLCCLGGARICWGQVTCSCGAMSHEATLTSTAIYPDIRDCQCIVLGPFHIFTPSCKIQEQSLYLWSGLNMIPGLYSESSNNQQVQSDIALVCKLLDTYLILVWKS